MEKNKKIIPEGFDSKTQDTDFVASLRSLSVSDIKPSYKGGKPKLITASIIMRLSVLSVCVAVFLYSGYSIIKSVHDDRKSEQFLAGIIDSVNAESAVSRSDKIAGSTAMLCLSDLIGKGDDASNNNEITDQAGKYDALRFRILELKAKNKDIYGWIRITGMVADTVEYPVVKGADNDVYLYRDIDGNYSESGSIFVDYRNSPVHSKNYNTVFYGHCMTNGTMFRPIMYWYEDPARNSTANSIKIEIITLDAVYVYEVFSAYRSEGSHFVTTSFANEETYLEFLKTIYARSRINRKVKFDTNSRIITLSTCTNVVAKPDERYVVHAILTQTIKYS